MSLGTQLRSPNSLGAGNWVSHNNHRLLHSPCLLHWLWLFLQQIFAVFDPIFPAGNVEGALCVQRLFQAQNVSPAPSAGTPLPASLGCCSASREAFPPQNHPAKVEDSGISQTRGILNQEVALSQRCGAQQELISIPCCPLRVQPGFAFKKPDDGSI